MITKARVSWSAKELIYLHAAMTLPFHEALEALDDIASLSGRTISAVRSKMDSMRRAERPAPSMAAAELVSGAAIRQLSPEALMAGRAPRRPKLEAAR